MRIFTIGETTYDILFRESVPVAAHSGGSAYNSSISLGRCGLPVSLISTFGTDSIGDLSYKFLTENGVNCQLIKRFEGKSRIALAFFDRDNNAKYSFYPASQDVFPEYPMPQENDILLLGSSFALRDNGRDELINFLRQAKEKGCITIYDPNARQCLTENPELLQKISQNIGLATIVKGSDEDFRNIFGAENCDEALSGIIKEGNNILVYTKGGSGAEFVSSKFRFHTNAKPVKVVSTIGAGDNFSAGLVFGLYQILSTNKKIDDLTSNLWEEIMNYGTHFASAVCGSSDNYIPLEDAKLLRSDNILSE